MKIMQDHRVQQHLRSNNFFSNFAVALHLFQILGILNRRKFDVKIHIEMLKLAKLNKQRLFIPVICLSVRISPYAR